MRLAVDSKINVEDYIPQRKPFLFINKCLDHTSESAITQYTFTNDMDVFRGHFPGNPVVPGVLLCESVFQTGALLMGLRNPGAGEAKTAVVTRINGTKFKNIAKPDMPLEIKVDLKEEIANAAYMKGKITSGGKTIMTIDFACAFAQ